MYKSGNTCTGLEEYLMIASATASATEQEMTMRGRRTVIAISAAIGLGIVGAASAAQANDSQSENNQGGSVMPGSSVGVNPVYHPGWFGRFGSAHTAYGYAALPIHKHHPVRGR
jgi:hypothetical protein